MDVVGVAEMPTMRMRRKVKRVRVSSTKIERLESHVSPQEGVKGILEGAKGPRRRRIGLRNGLVQLPTLRCRVIPWGLKTSRRSEALPILKRLILLTSKRSAFQLGSSEVGAKIEYGSPSFSNATIARLLD